MEKVDIILALVSITFLLFVCLLVPLLVQIWKTAKSVQASLSTLNRHLPVILKNVEEITFSLSRTSSAVKQRVEELSLTLGKVQGTIGVLAGFEEMFRRSAKVSLFKSVRTISAIVKGIKAFAHVLLISSKEGKEPRD